MALEPISRGDLPGNDFEDNFDMPPPWTKQGEYFPKKEAKTEAELQVQAANYLRRCYPQVLFHHDAHSAVQVHIQTAQHAKAKGVMKGWPDLMVMRPRGGYAGLFVELKKPGLRLYKVRSGAPYNEHFSTQLAVHEELREAGYAVEVAQSLTSFKQIIDNYMQA